MQKQFAGHIMVWTSLLNENTRDFFLFFFLFILCFVLS